MDFFVYNICYVISNNSAKDIHFDIDDLIIVIWLIEQMNDLATIVFLIIVCLFFSFAFNQKRGTVTKYQTKKMNNCIAHTKRKEKK